MMILSQPVGPGLSWSSLIHVTLNGGDTRSVGIATINAAIVAVFLGALVAYVVVVLQRLHEMTDDVMTTALTINDLEIDNQIPLDAQDADLFRGYHPREFHDGPSMMTRLSLASMRLPDAAPAQGGVQYTAEDMLPVADSARRARSIMAVVVTQYPFKPIRNGEQSFINGVVELSTPDDAVAWSGDVERLATFAQSIHRDTLRSLLENAAEQDPILARLQGGPARLSEAFDYSLASERFFEMLDDAHSIARATRNKYAELHRYRNARWSRANLKNALTAAVAAAVVLVAGVLTPMVHPTAPTWVYAWAPAGIYFLGMAGGLAWLTRRFIRAPSVPR